MSASGKKAPGVSRRDLLFGLVNRLRGPAEDGRQLSSLAAQEIEADNLAATGDYAKATQVYRSLLVAHPQLAEARAKLGRCLYASGRLVQAKVELLRARREGAGPAAVLYLGLCLAREGYLGKAAVAWKDYFNAERPELMREINVFLAQLEQGQAGEPQEAEGLGRQTAEAIDVLLGLKPRA